MRDYQEEQPWLPFSEALLEWDDDFHELMLQDQLRMAAYRKAIEETVCPGDVVLDLGTGTGILSLWALQAGASRVYGIDLSAPVLARAVERMEQAGLADRFVPINQLSFDVSLPERVDVLISEIMGNMADNEDFQPILRDAIPRFLKAGGRVLPQSTATYLVPVAARQAHRSLVEREVSTLSPKYSMERLCREKGIRSPFNIYYDTILPRRTYLSRARCLYRYQGEWEQPPCYSVDVPYPVHKAEWMTGFKAYFVAQLSPSVTLDISGDDIGGGATSASWKHAYLPIEHPLQVAEGDTVSVRFSRFYPDAGARFRQVYRWQGEVLRAGNVIAQFDQCMDESLTVSPEVVSG
ncbi:methyltransferase domain-containing protein [Marinobacter lipolyticus]|uniref:methyltransferase domain-containing protein n=1 Tax=Marinobacter lipolyticus TaxID=209639 RepID=UPI003A8E50A4